MDGRRWKRFFAPLILTLLILTPKVYAGLSWESEIEKEGVPGEGYGEFRKISEHMARGFEKNPMLKQMNITGMMNKLDGFPVKTVNRIPGGRTNTTTLKRIERRSLSKDLFEVPRGYTVKQEDISEPIDPQQMPDEMPEELKKMIEQMMKETGKSQE